MLTTVAFCSVLFDYQGLWVSLLPDDMQGAIHSEWGVDPWDTEVQAVMARSVGAAAEGNGAAALHAMNAAEKEYQGLTPDDITVRMGECLDLYRVLAAQ